MEEDLIDNFLAHYGVAGMKWGKRTKKPISAQIKKLEKKRDRFNANNIVRGAELTGWAINKGSKNPSRRASTSVALRGAAEVAIILAGGNVAINAMGAHGKTLQKGRIAVAGLAAQAATMRVHELKSIHDFKSHKEIINQINDLQKQQKAQTKN